MQSQLETLALANGDSFDVRAVQFFDLRRREMRPPAITMWQSSRRSVVSPTHADAYQIEETFAVEVLLEAPAGDDTLEEFMSRASLDVEKRLRAVDWWALGLPIDPEIEATTYKADDESEEEDGSGFLVHTRYHVDINDLETILGE